MEAVAFVAPVFAVNQIESLLHLGKWVGNIGTSRNLTICRIQPIPTSKWHAEKEELGPAGADAKLRKIGFTTGVRRLGQQYRTPVEGALIDERIGQEFEFMHNSHLPGVACLLQAVFGRARAKEAV